MRVYKDSDPTLTILGRFCTGAGLRGGVSFHCPTSRQLAFSIRWAGRRVGSPGPGCLPHAAGGFEAGIVHVVRFFWGIGGRACALGKTTPRERRLLTSQLLFHSSHRATHLGEERERATGTEIQIFVLLLVETLGLAAPAIPMLPAVWLNEQ